MTGVPEPAYEAAPTSTTPAGGVDHRQRAAESPFLRAPALSPRRHGRTDRYHEATRAEAREHEHARRRVEQHQRDVAAAARGAQLLADAKARGSR